MRNVSVVLFAPSQSESGVLSGVGWDSVFWTGFAFVSYGPGSGVWPPGGAAGTPRPNSPRLVPTQLGESDVDVNRENVGERGVK